LTAIPETAAEPTPLRHYPPRRVVRIDLPGEWEGFYVVAWVNADWQRRQRILTLKDKSEDEVRAVVKDFILDHNLTDFDGEPLPKVGEDGFFERVPSDALAVIFQEVLGQFGKLTPPNAGTSKRT